MLVEEVGILIESIPIICRKYNQTENNVGITNKSALISSLINFAENLISPLEYFEGNNYNIIFKKKKGATEMDANLFIYIVINKLKNFERKWKKKVMTLLENITDKFYLKYSVNDYSEISIFSDFNNVIDNMINKLK
ncbi:MAG: hypothetical protein JXA99_01700 [Candidatus Lokiarchaeota archaeon]|nr:hypothetical protein [Candidatus Lokiarchaeota archaeon]